MMEKIETGFEGLYLLKPRVFEDDRGHFFESFNQKNFNELVGGNIQFLQDNQSFSNKDVLRGLHFQKPPFEQGKLVRSITGSVLDIVVDIRKNSATYGQHYGATLSAENKHLLWIPPGFAHGFLCLEDGTVFNYKCTNYYDKASEDSLLWNDSDLDIDWKVANPILSEKDEQANQFKDFASPF
jgi:dTDP-4-dehydrorhamnose 3,5-epimerase